MAAKRRPKRASPTQRARPPAPEPSPNPTPPKAERVQLIVGLMAEGQWVTGITGPQLAARWGLSESRLRDDAAEASRRIRDTVADDDELRSRIRATLETITSRAMTRGELRTAIESIKALAGVSGVEPPRKVDVGGSLAELLALGLSPDGAEPDPAVGE